MIKNIAVILGDGVGPEIGQQAIKVLDAVGRQFKHSFRFRYGFMGYEAKEKTGEVLPANTLQACLHSDAILIGAISNAKYSVDAPFSYNFEDSFMKLHEELGLFANICPFTIYPSLQYLSPLKNGRLEGVDLIIFRELAGLSKTIARENDVIENGRYSEAHINKIVEPAFQLARKRRKKLTFTYNSDTTESSIQWLSVVKDFATRNTDIMVGYLSAADTATELIVNPKQFDVILTNNFSGQMLNGEASSINGSVDLLPSSLIGSQHAVFQSAYPGRPQAAGKNTANPVGCILSVAMMLEYFGMNEEADLVKDAVQWTIANSFVSRDIDPVNNYSTSTIGEIITDYVENRIPSRINKENISISKSTII